MGEGRNFGGTFEMDGAGVWEKKGGGGGGGGNATEGAKRQDLLELRTSLLNDTVRFDEWCRIKFFLGTPQQRDSCVGSERRD